MMRIFAMLLLCCATRAEATEPIERLFFSPGERRKMDDIRDRSGRTSGGEYVAPSMDGMVQRSDGKNTIWINGRPFDANDRQATRAATLPPDAEMRVRVRGQGQSTVVERKARTLTPKLPK